MAEQVISVTVFCAKNVNCVIQVVHSGHLGQPGFHLTHQKVLESGNAWYITVKLKPEIRFVQRGII